MNKEKRRLELFINPIVVGFITRVFKEHVKDRNLEDWLVEYINRYAMEILLTDKSIWRTDDDWMKILHDIQRKLKEDYGIDWTGGYISEYDLRCLANDLEEFSLVANE